MSDHHQTAAVVEEVGSEPLGDGQHHLPVGHIGEDRLLEPQTPQRQPFGMATGAEVTALAREGQQQLVLAGAAAHAGEPMLQDAAGEELLDHLGDDGPPGAPAPLEALVVDGGELLEVILDQAIEG